MKNRPLRTLFDLFSADEKRALLDEIGAGGMTLAALDSLAAARRRTLDRQRSDAKTDGARRILVGARVPRETAERYRECAAAHGMSLYAFVCSALEREYRSLMGG